MKDMFNRAAAFRSAMLIAGSTYVSYVVGLIVSIILARQLGPRDYGHYAYLVWLSGMLTIFYCNGASFTAIRFVSESIGRGNAALARNVQNVLGRWYLAGIAVVTFGFLLAYPWLQPTDWDEAQWIFLGAAIIAGLAKSGYMVGVSFAKGHGRFDIDAYTAYLVSAINLVAVLGLSLFRPPVVVYIILFVVLSILYALVSFYLMRRAGIVSGQPDVPPELLSRMKTHFFWSAVLFLFLALSNKAVETFFLNSYVGPEAVAWFAIAAAMTRGGIDMLAAGLSSVLMPMMSHASGSSDPDRVKRIFVDAFRYYLALGLFLAGAGVLWSEPVILLLYGPGYEPAIIGLRVMIVVGALTMPEGAINPLLATMDRQSVRVALAVAAMLLTLVASVALVPTYGFMGALASHALARTLTFVVALAMVVRSFDIELPLVDLMREVGAALVGLALAAAVLAVSTSSLAQFAAGVVFGLGCVGGSLVLRVWTKGDLKLVSGIIARFPRLRFLLDLLESRARGV